MYVMWNSVNILTLQYRVYSEIALNKNLYHIETSQAICNTMLINWMVLIDTLSLAGQSLDFFEN